jgi:uncharacterized coiled-coil protein SlyX
MNVPALEHLETKIAFLERASVELSDVVFRQHQEIEILRAQLAALSARIEAAQSDGSAPAAQEERPPHY